MYISEYITLRVCVCEQVLTRSAGMLINIHNPSKYGQIRPLYPYSKCTCKTVSGDFLHWPDPHTFYVDIRELFNISIEPCAMVYLKIIIIPIIKKRKHSFVHFCPSLSFICPFNLSADQISSFNSHKRARLPASNPSSLKHTIARVWGSEVNRECKSIFSSELQNNHWKSLNTVLMQCT